MMGEFYFEIEELFDYEEEEEVVFDVVVVKINGEIVKK